MRATIPRTGHVPNGSLLPPASSRLMYLHTLIKFRAYAVGKMPCKRD